MLKPWRILAAILVFGLLPLYSARAAPRNPDLLSPQIVINLPSRTLELLSDGKLVKRYPVAIGKPSTPTPLGTYSIQYKEKNPAWYPPETPGKFIPSGPYNPLGYRWMGFLPTYGVHGTNNPSSIGHVVSNGCIRMYEEDVEELYEVVDVDIPLMITYERVRVGMDAQNRAYVAVYPDVYGYQDVTVKDVRDKLRPHGWNEWIDDTTIRRLIDESDEKEYVFLQFHNLVVNGKLLAEKVQVNPTGLLVPLLPVAEAVKGTVIWNGSANEVKVGSRKYLGLQKGQSIFAAPASIPVLFGGSQYLNASKNALELEILTLTLNGKPVAGDFPLLAEMPLLPVLTIAEALEQNVVWDEKTKTVTLRNQKLPIQVVEGRPYIPINKVYETFEAYVYWNEAARNIDLTYPFQEPLQ